MSEELLLGSYIVCYVVGVIVSKLMDGDLYEPEGLLGWCFRWTLFYPMLGFLPTALAVGVFGSLGKAL